MKKTDNSEDKYKINIMRYKTIEEKMGEMDDANEKNKKNNGR